MAIHTLEITDIQKVGKLYAVSVELVKPILLTEAELTKLVRRTGHESVSEYTEIIGSWFEEQL